MRDLTPCDLEWIENAPQVARISEHITAPPAQVFAAFADASTWPRWFPLMTGARWLDAAGGPAGGGVGREREVTLRGFGTFRERFLAFDEPSRFAFTVIASSSSMMKRFGEDYRLTAEGNGTRFEWIMGAEAAGIGKLVAPGMKLFMQRLLRRAARNVNRYLAEHPAPVAAPAQRTTTYEKPATSSK